MLDYDYAFMTHMTHKNSIHICILFVSMLTTHMCSGWLRMQLII